MAPVHLQKRRNDYLESPNRNRRCMESRKHTIADEHLRSHCVEPDRPASMLGSTINVVSSWFNVLTTSVSSKFTGGHFTSLFIRCLMDYSPNLAFSQPAAVTCTHQVETPSYFYQRDHDQSDARGSDTSSSFPRRLPIITFSKS